MSIMVSASMLTVLAYSSQETSARASSSFSRINALPGKQRDGRPLHQVGNGIHHAAHIGQSAALRLGKPLLGVAVSVENDAPVRGHFPPHKRLHGAVKILRLLKLVGKRAKRIGHNRVEHHVGIGDAAGGRNHPELKFIARKSKGRCAVPVGGIPADERQRGHAHPHDRGRGHALVARPG